MLLAGLLVCGQLSVTPCTVAVVSGKVTLDGCPLLWKNRDTSAVNNKIAYFQGEKYTFIGLITAGHKPVQSVWAGINTQGFAIINSASSDLAESEKSGRDNGRFMKKALGQCGDVADFEKLLQKTKGKRQVSSNYGVIDAYGNACFFETSNTDYAKFDADNPRVAPNGYIVHTNFAYTSSVENGGGGYIRFERVSRLFQNASAEKRLNVRFILQDAARDLVNQKLHSYPLTDPPAGHASPVYINTNDTINRNSTVSVAVFHGPPNPQKTHLSTMWILLGQGICTSAAPLWPHAQAIPDVLGGEGKAPMNQLAQKIRDYLYPDQRGHMKQYLHLDRFLNYKENGVLGELLSIENEVLARTQERLNQWKKEKPRKEAMFAFEEKIANWVYTSLKDAFPFVD